MKIEEFEKYVHNLGDILLEAVCKCEKIEKSGQLNEGGRLEYLVYTLKKDLMHVEGDLIMICDAFNKWKGV